MLPPPHFDTLYRILNSLRILLRLATETIAHPPEPTPVLLSKIDQKIQTPDFIKKYNLMKLYSFRILTKIGDLKIEKLNKNWSNVMTQSYSWKDGLVIESKLTAHNKKMQDHYTTPEMGKVICTGLKRVMSEEKFRKTLGLVRSSIVESKQGRVEILRKTVERTGVKGSDKKTDAYIKNNVGEMKLFFIAYSYL